MRLLLNIISRRISFKIGLAVWLLAALLMSALMMAASHGFFSGIDTSRIVETSIPDRIDEIEYPQVELQQIQRVLNSDTKDFSEAISPNLSGIQPDFGSQSLGIIVPHHLVAAQALALTYDWISDYQPDAIVLLTPNHQQLIKAPIITRSQAILAYQQHFSMHPIVKEFSNQGLVTVDNASFLREHGFYNHLAFISANGWQVPIIPVAMARNASLDSLMALRHAINDSFSDQKVLWIASIDFSHYLPASTATLMDQETKQWIDKKDYNSILESTSDHLDAPAVLVMWLMQFENTHFIWQSNSAQITGGGHHLPGTSYLIYYGN